MIAELFLDQIEFNRFNPRLRYTESSLEQIGKSMSDHGLLSSIRVRPSARSGKYELVFGHRRFLAAKRLGWKKIRAEIVEMADDVSIKEALVENMEREDLSDYEKALIFERLNSEFGKTYDQIGEIIGLSKQSVSNHMAMLRLFDEGFLSADAELQALLHEITEYHSRVLSRIPDQQTRARLLRMIVAEGLSAREVSKLVFRLRGWFLGGGEDSASSGKAPRESQAGEIDNPNVTSIKEVIRKKLVFSQTGEFDKLDKLYLFGKGYSTFPAFNEELLENEEAAAYKHSWSQRVASRMLWELRDVTVRILSSGSAVATARVRFFGNGDQDFVIRGSVVLVSRKGGWKIVHEHWSKTESSRVPAVRAHAPGKSSRMASA